MRKAQQARFESLYQRHINALRRQGKAENTIDGYSRALRRITEFFDRVPDRLTQDDLKDYFSSLTKTHSWSTVKVDRNGLQFFYKHVLNKQWQWVDIVKPPQKTVLPDILTLKEIERMINGTRERRYQAFILTAFSMGLRIHETLNLRIGDVDAQRMKVHIRLGKGKKDRFVTLPEATLIHLRQYWATHRHPNMIFPAGRNHQECQSATKIMDRGGLQKAFKAILTSIGIHKHATPHTLRHCYGALLIENGVNLRAVQTEMGHDCPKTTALYTQLTEVTQKDTDKIINRMVNRLNIVLAEEE